MHKHIGVDVSSTTLNIHFNDKDLSIPNTEEGILNFLKGYSLNPKKTTFGFESTGRYHHKLQKILVEKHFFVKVINPILTNKRIKLSIRGKKTDISDAQIITELIKRGEGAEVTIKQMNTSRRTKLRVRASLVKHKTSLKLMIQDLNRDTNVEELKNTIETLKRSINDLEGRIEELDKEIETGKTETENLIESIPGFATRLSAVVASEIGEFERFPSARELKAYVGVDPKVKQSGNMNLKKGITKRGNPHLRTAFYLAAQVARRYDPELKEFYEKKIGEGKHYKVVIVAVARKLCERVYAVVKKGEPYVVKSI